MIKTIGISGGVIAGGLILSTATAKKWGPNSPQVDDPREPSFWEKDAGQMPETTQLTSDIQVDMAVIGSGITGLSAACTLKELRPELKVCVLESHRPCSGASSRNSAHMKGEYHSWESIYSSEGPEVAFEWNKFSQRGLEDAINFTKTNNIDCNLHKETLMWLATRNKAGKLKTMAKRMKDVGLKGTIVTGKKFHDKVGTDFYQIGFEDFNNYITHPGKMMKGFLQTALDRGVMVYSASPVMAVANSDSKTETNILKTPKGSVAAKKVMFASNAYTPRIKGLLSSRMVPIVLATIATEPLTPSQKAAAGVEFDHMTEVQLISRTLGHTPDNRIYFRGILGYSSFNSCVWKNLDKAYNRLEREMKERMPWTRDLKVTLKWPGAVALTYSGKPIAGPLPLEGQYVSLGYGGFGMVNGYYHGKLVAHRMVGADHPDMKFLRGPSGWIPPEPSRSIGAKTFFSFTI